MIPAVISDGRLVISCKGMTWLKIKTELNRLLGGGVEGSNGELSVPASSAAMVLTALPNLNLESSNDYLELIRRHAEARVKALDSIKSHLTDLLPLEWTQILDEAQRYAVNAMVVPGLLGLCLFDEQGSGKTVMTIASMSILRSRGEIDSTIVVAPKSMLPGWEQDVRKFLGQSSVVTLLDGGQKEKLNKLNTKSDVYVVNYEGIGNILGSIKFLAKSEKCLLVVDESYYAKNPDAVRSDRLAELRPLCTRCFVLCGTPAPNKAYDLVNQLNLADNHYSFPAFVKSSDEVADIARIQDGLQNRSTVIRRMKREVLSFVPVKNFEIIQVELKGRQRYLYEKARDELCLELRRLDNTRFRRYLHTYLQRRETLLQICSVPKNVDSAFAEDSAKLLALDQKLIELFSQQRKVIVWATYRSAIEELRNRYDQYRPLVIYGGSSTRDRKEAVELFQTDSSRLLLIANPEACGAGITLHAAYDAVYYSFTNKAASYLQSIDRIHRRGQMSSIVNYYLFVCKGTIEEREVERLKDKEEDQHELLHDAPEESMTLQDALNELHVGGLSS